MCYVVDVSEDTPPGKHLSTLRNQPHIYLEKAYTIAWNTMYIFHIKTDHVSLLFFRSYDTLEEHIPK